MGGHLNPVVTGYTGSESELEIEIVRYGFGPNSLITAQRDLPAPAPMS